MSTPKAFTSEVRLKGVCQTAIFVSFQFIVSGPVSSAPLIRDVPDRGCLHLILRTYPRILPTYQSEFGIVGNVNSILPLLIFDVLNARVKSFGSEIPSIDIVALASSIYSSIREELAPVSQSLSIERDGDFHTPFLAE